MTGPSKLVRFSSITERKIDWLWAYRIPRGTVGLLMGDGGLGKSVVTVDLAARVSTGRPMPGEHARGQPGGVVLLTAEDSVEVIVTPRLRLAGANMDLCYCWPEKDYEGLVFPRDIKTLAAEILAAEARLVIIDPLSAFMSDKINSWNDTEIRRVLRPLRVVAEKTGAAIVCVMHVNKDDQKSPIHRVMGSAGFANAARWVLGWGRDPDPANFDDRKRVLVGLKSNYGILPRSLGAMVVPDHGESYPVIEWGGEMLVGPEDVFGRVKLTGPSKPTQHQRAMDFIKDQLGAPDTFYPAAEILNAAVTAGISRSTLDRASADLGVRKQRMGGLGAEGAWFWYLPGSNGAVP